MKTRNGFSKWKDTALHQIYWKIFSYYDTLRWTIFLRKDIFKQENSTWKKNWLPKIKLTSSDYNLSVAIVCLDLFYLFVCFFFIIIAWKILKLDLKIFLIKLNALFCKTRLYEIDPQFESLSQRAWSYDHSVQMLCLDVHIYHFWDV